MIERLRLIAAEHGIGHEAIEELIDLYTTSVPRTPTLRVGDAEEATSPPLPSSPESFLERYEDRGRLAVGGFSEVREAWDRHVKRIVALKLQLHERVSPEGCMRFRKEVWVTARLQHPGVVPLHDWGELRDGRIWFTMKRVRGATIGRRIAELRRQHGAEMGLALRRLIDDFRRLCEPVAYAHSLGIIHRDITPANLMVGELGEVHVMDWGLARQLGGRSSDNEPSGTVMDDRAREVSLSEVRTRVTGTPSYMSPEQARGEIAAMSAASDVYALGAVLYEILSGCPPYMNDVTRSEHPEEIIRRVRLGPPRPIDEVARSEVPRELCLLCRKAMEREAGARFEHAGIVMGALRDWLDGSDRTARAREIVAAAQREHRSLIERKLGEAERLRARSRAVLGRLQPFDRAQDKAEGWQLADEAKSLEQQALREEIQWTQKLRAAINAEPDLEEAHTLLAEHYAGSLLRAEAKHDDSAAASSAAFLQDHASKVPLEQRCRYEALLRGDGWLTMITDPEPAQVLIMTYEPLDRYLMTNENKALVAQSPIVEMRLARGSYLLLVRAKDRREARYPVWVGRDDHWDGIRPGGSAPHPIRLLGDDELGPDDVYVPAGWFLAGGDPSAGEGFPRRKVWVDSFVIRRHPVTNGEYVAFLNELVGEGRADEALRHCPRIGPAASVNDDGPLAYARDPATGRFSLRSPNAERALPVVLVDWYGAMAYADQCSRKTGLPWRLPNELEWEKAARGVDGRFMPWGDQVEPTWACLSGSHPDKKGLMPIQHYATDVSPYGVRGMAGNVRDWCMEAWTIDGPVIDNDIVQPPPRPTSDHADRSIRGGSWISIGDLARLSVRYSEKPTRRHGVLGFRLARSVT